MVACSDEYAWALRHGYDSHNPPTKVIEQWLDENSLPPAAWYMPGETRASSIPCMSRCWYMQRAAPQDVLLSVWWESIMVLSDVVVVLQGGESRMWEG